MPDNGSIQLSDWKLWYGEVNATQVAPEDRLSDKSSIMTVETKVAAAWYRKKVF